MKKLSIVAITAACILSGCSGEGKEKDSSPKQKKSSTTIRSASHYVKNINCENVLKQAEAHPEETYEYMDFDYQHFYGAEGADKFTEKELAKRALFVEDFLTCNEVKDAEEVDSHTKIKRDYAIQLSSGDNQNDISDKKTKNTLEGYFYTESDDDRDLTFMQIEKARHIHHKEKGVSWDTTAEFTVADKAVLSIEYADGTKEEVIGRVIEHPKGENYVEDNNPLVFDVSETHTLDELRKAHLTMQLFFNEEHIALPYDLIKEFEVDEFNL